MNNKISANLQNDIMKVLRGETKVEIPLPNAIINAARTAAAELKQLSLTEGYLSAESKKQVLRKNLNEGLEKCGCSPTTNMIARYEEEAMKPVAEEKVEENAEELDESSEEMVDEAGVAKLKRLAIAHDKAKYGSTRAGITNPEKAKRLGDALSKMKAKVQAKQRKRNFAPPQAFGMKEETEAQITEELKNFVTNLTAEDRNILRGLLEAQD